MARIPQGGLWKSIGFGAGFSLLPHSLLGDLRQLLPLSGPLCQQIQHEGLAQKRAGLLYTSLLCFQLW